MQDNLLMIVISVSCVWYSLKLASLVLQMVCNKDVCNAGHAEQLAEADVIADDDSSKHVSSTFRGVYKRKFDTKWRAEITAGAPYAHLLF